jgi:pimeloyl-ACP methyl ester carboxylesterase
MRFARGPIEIAYEVDGDENGRPLLMIMGLGAQLVFWPRGLVDPLLRAGFRVIRMDNRDAGLSTHLSSRPTLASLVKARALGQREYDLYDMAADAVALLDHLGLATAHIVGCSMGGMIAQIVAAQCPERTLSLTSIMSSSGELSDFIPAPRALAGLARARASSEQVDQIVATYLAIAGRRGRSETLLREMAMQAVDRGYSASGMRRQLAAILATGSRRRELRSIPVPSLIVHGTDDPLVRPVAARKLASLIPKARLHWIEGMGHGLPRPVWLELAKVIEDHARGAEQVGVASAKSSLKSRI